MQVSLQVSISSQKCLPGWSASWQCACTYSNPKAGLALVVYLNNEKVVALASCSVVLRKFLPVPPPADSPDNVNNEENSTTSDHVVQPPAGLSAEDVQRIATAVADLVGCPSSSNNPLVSGPSQVPTPPTAGTEFVYRVVYSWCNCNPASLSGSSQITEPMGAYSTFLNSATLVLLFLKLLSQHGEKDFFVILKSPD